MNRQKYIFRPFFTAMAIILSFQIIFPYHAFSITENEEEELSKEFMRMVLRRYEVIRDPMISEYINELGHKILSTVPTQPFQYHFYVIRDDSYNAFAAPAGHIFVNSGLIKAMDSEDELAGILSHEISHVVCRHISQKIERSSKVGLATLAGIVAGVLLGVGGAGAAAVNAVTIGSVAAGQSASLAYSRKDEAQADQIGLRYLTDAGYDPRGLLVILKKIRSKQWFDSKDIPTYLLTHPAVDQRLAYIDSWIGANNTKVIPSDTYKFGQAKAWLTASYADEANALKIFQAKISEQPQNPTFQYGYALALERVGKRGEAIAYLKKALEKKVFDSHLLKELGRLYFLNGQYGEAQKILEGAADSPEARFYLGRCYLENNHPEEAVAILEELTDQWQEYEDAYYFLAEAYGKLDRPDEAHFCLGIYYKLKGDFKNSVFHLNKASKLSGSPFRKQKAEDVLKDMRKKGEEKEKEEDRKEQEKPKPAPEKS